MKKIERLNIYKKLSVSPKFDKLPERLQEFLSYLAAGYVDDELVKMYKISQGTPWDYRRQIFMRYGLRVFENGRTRAMTMEEIKHL